MYDTGETFMEIDMNARKAADIAGRTNGRQMLACRTDVIAISV